MKVYIALAAVLFVPAVSHAQAKACEELKTEIAAKLDAKGVKAYTLDVVAKDQDADGKQVGSCEGGTKKIMYRRGAAPAQTASAPSAAKEGEKSAAAKEPEKQQ
jgi:Protein of unknown function (DUF1161)